MPQRSSRLHIGHLLKVNTCFSIIALLVAVTACATRYGKENNEREIAYPSPVPFDTASLFLPDVVNTDSLELNAAFSRDGESFYFSRKTPVGSRIYATHYRQRTWTKAVVLPFHRPGFSDADPAIGDDGTLYFISDRPKDAQDTIRDYDIWFSTPTADSSWNKATRMTIVNSDSNEFYISLATSGNLYFASSRAGGAGQEDIYMSRHTGKTYHTPQTIGAPVNTDHSEYDPFIFPDESAMIFTSSNRADGFGAGDLYASVKDKNGKWRPSVNLGSAFNTKAREYCAFLTRDGKYFFFSRSGEVMWIDARTLQKQFVDQYK